MVSVMLTVLIQEKTNAKSLCATEISPVVCPNFRFCNEILTFIRKPQIQFSVGYMTYRLSDHACIVGLLIKMLIHTTCFVRVFIEPRYMFIKKLIST